MHPPVQIKDRIAARLKQERTRLEARLEAQLEEERQALLEKKRKVGGWVVGQFRGRGLFGTDAWLVKLEAQLEEERQALLENKRKVGAGHGVGWGERGLRGGGTAARLWCAWAGTQVKSVRPCWERRET